MEQRRQSRLSRTGTKTQLKIHDSQNSCFGAETELDVHKRRVGCDECHAIGATDTKPSAIEPPAVFDEEKKS